MTTLIDPLRDTIAVLDEHGVIVSVNRVWRDFAESNGGSTVLASGVGLDYLAVVRRAAGSDSCARARSASNILSDRSGKDLIPNHAATTTPIRMGSRCLGGMSSPAMVWHPRRFAKLGPRPVGS